MITVYKNGQELLNENKAYLNTNKYQAVFFIWDAPLLKEPDHINYALRCDVNGGTLLALKVEPYNLLLFGDPSCSEELLAFLTENNYEIKNYFCGCDVGNACLRIFKEKYGVAYEESLAMDFMEARSVQGQPCDEVETAVEDDIDEIVECLEMFKVDCNLNDQVNREKTLATIGNFRVIRRDGHIVSMAKIVESSGADIRVIDVYTRNAYRGQGLARKVVTNATIEILASGNIATLNVDRRNPVTNHLYRAIGYVPLFSQGEYRKI